MNKIIPLIFLTLFLLIPQHQTDLKNIPAQGMKFNTGKLVTEYIAPVNIRERF